MGLRSRLGLAAGLPPSHAAGKSGIVDGQSAERARSDVHEPTDSAASLDAELAALRRDLHAELAALRRDLNTGLDGVSRSLRGSRWLLYALLGVEIVGMYLIYARMDALIP